MDDLFFPLLLPPSDDSGGSGGSGGSGDTGGPEDLAAFYAGYASAFRVADDASANLHIEVVEPSPPPEVVTVVVPQACTLSWFTPAGGQTLPTGAPVTEDTAVLEVYPGDLTSLSAALPGRPVCGWWLLGGVDGATVEAEATAWAQASSYAQLGIPETASDAERAAAEGAWVAGLMSGTIAAPLEAGTTIGRLGSSLTLVVSLVEVGGTAFHPAMLLASFAEANPRLVGHPLATACAALDLDVQIFLQFRYFKVDNTSPIKGEFAWLEGATVEVRDADPLVDDVLDTGVTDADGRVTFFVSSWDWSGTADLYFRVTIDETRAILVQYARNTTWHGSWSTWQPERLDGTGGVGVTALDGATRGYFPDYSGWGIGSPIAPIGFNLGTPVFLAVTYEAAKTPATVAAWRKAPRGLEVELGSWSEILVSQLTGDDAYAFTRLDTLYADEDGEVWGTTFAAEFGRRLEIALPLAMAEDADADFIDSKEMPRYVILAYPSRWQGYVHDPANLSWESFGAAAIGEPAALRAVMVDHQPNDDVAATLYMLKTIRDTHLWFRALTGGDWKGQDYCFALLIPSWITEAAADIRTFMLDYFPAAIPMLPSSNWPQLGLGLHQRDKWSRDTIAHEYAHTVMWAIASVDLHDLACAVVWGDYNNHETWKEYTEFAALIEGWSDMVAHALGATSHYELPATPPSVKDAAGNTIALDSVPLIGRRIEGCLATALWLYLEQEWGLRRVVDSDSSDLQEADPGGGTRTNTSFAGASLAFLKTIWEPAQAMQDTWTGYPGTMDFLGEVEESMEESNWIVLDTEYLHVWNIT